MNKRILITSLLFLGIILIGCGTPAGQTPSTVPTEKAKPTKFITPTEIVKPTEQPNPTTDPKEFANWYQKITIDDLKNTKKVESTDTLVSILSKKEYLILLDSIPKDNIYLYGCSNGVILRVKNKFQFFEWNYLTPRLIFPRIGCADYDKDGQKEVAISLYTGSGTGISIERLFLVKTRKDGTMHATEFDSNQYNAQLSERVVGKYDKTLKMLQFYIDGKKAGKGINLTELIMDLGDYDRIVFGEQILFNFINNKIILEAKPGLVLKDMAAPMYDTMPNISAKVVFKNNKFSLTDFEFKEATE